MAADSAAAAGGRAGITFGVELVIPWDAPESVIDLNSDGLMDLDIVPDVIGLTGRLPDAAVCRILQGRDVRSVRALVPDSRGLERNFHDVTIVDMGDLPEVSVSIDDLSPLRSANNGRPRCSAIWCGCNKTWIRCVQRPVCRKRFWNARPGRCSYCNKLIKCDMYRHVSTYHLDLAQLWRCPVSWCTVWKGAPQDCMDHVRGPHDVPWDIKSASLEKVVLPWTVWRQVWTDSLAANHSGISTDILLVSDIHLSLTHHYRVHKRGLPHIAFRSDYLARLCGSVSQAAGQSRHDTISPVASSPVSSHYARSAEQESETSRLTRRGRRRMRPVRILQGSVGDLQVLTAQDTSDLPGALVYDCRPPLLPVSLRLEVIGAFPSRRTVALASLAAPPQEDFMEIGGVSPEGVTVPELGVAPLVNTELEDELPAPEDSPLCHDSSLEGARPPRVCSATRELVDLELEKALLSVSILPDMVTPLEEPVEGFPVAPSSYPEPLVPVLPYDDPDAPSRVSPLWVAADGPGLDVFPTYLTSPAYSVYEPATSPVTPYLQEDAAYQPPPSPATMDQYLARDGDLLLGDVVALPVLSSPLTPLPVVVDMAPESCVGSPAGVPVAPSSDGMLYLSREGPFDVLQDALESGATPQVINSFPGCQYRMTSYDDSVDRSDLNPAYGFHLHDPRLLEYVGAPKSAHLLSHTVLDTPYGLGSGYVGCPAATA